MTSYQTDVVVIGGGPAGAGLATQLSQNGLSVVILERGKYGKSKPCGEYLTPGAVGILDNSLHVLPELLRQGAATVDSAQLSTANGSSSTLPSSGLCCPRPILDETLLAAAEKAGAEVRRGVNVRSLLQENSAVAGAATDTDTFRARWTVGADGTHSLVARQLNLVRPIRRLQRISLVRHFFASETDQNSVCLFASTDGFDGCCGIGPPCGPAHAFNVNLTVPISESSAIASRQEQYFDQRLRASFPSAWELVKNCAPASAVQTTPCFGHRTRTAAVPGALLVGDAAHYIHPFTGEGVYFALRGAQLAADAILHAIGAKMDICAPLWEYERARKRELAPRYWISDISQRLAHSSFLPHALNLLHRFPHMGRSYTDVIADIRHPYSLLAPGRAI